jgi:hypothetical protein
VQAPRVGRWDTEIQASAEPEWPTPGCASRLPQISGSRHHQHLPLDHHRGIHLAIGPGGVFVIDTKQWTGSVHQSPDGLAWHNHYPLDQTLETARWEAQIIGRLLGTRIHPLVCVHGAHVHGGGLHAQGVAIVPASLLRSGLGCDRVLSGADVELLATTAWTRLHPAA